MPERLQMYQFYEIRAKVDRARSYTWNGEYLPVQDAVRDLCDIVEALVKHIEAVEIAVQEAKAIKQYAAQQQLQEAENAACQVQQPPP